MHRHYLRYIRGTVVFLSDLFLLLHVMAVDGIVTNVRHIYCNATEQQRRSAPRERFEIP